MSGLPPITDAAVLVGTSTSDDGAVYRISDELAMIQSVDFFTPVVDRAFDFGAISAANSISDIYAMGGRPVLAMNVVGFPSRSDRVPLAVLGDILRGGAAKAAEAGVSVVGGHTIDDNEPKFGMAVTGFVHPDRIWRNVGGRAGDALVLTKALGTGIISTAMRAQKCSEASAQAAIASMSMLNRLAAETAQDFEVHACTDVTGFGLLGHLREMLRNTLDATIEVGAVPLLPGARELFEAGFFPGGSRRNFQAVQSLLDDAPSEISAELALLCDAQTSGGLLIAVPADEADVLAERCRSAGLAAARIGELSAGSGRIRLR